MSEEGYNGWTNRETWACNLWITSDEGLYQSARERLDADIAAWANANNLRDWWSELTDPDEELMDCKAILTMVRDIGQEDAINWDEIAEGLLEE